MPTEKLLSAISREPGRVGQALPEGTDALTLEVRSDPGNSNLEMAARVLDSHGQVHMRPFRTNTTSIVDANPNTMRASLSGLSQPLRIAAIILRPQARVVRAPTGTLYLDELTAYVGDEAIPVDPFDEAGPWIPASSGAGEDRIVFARRRAAVSLGPTRRCRRTDHRAGVAQSAGQRGDGPYLDGNSQPERRRCRVD